MTRIEGRFEIGNTKFEVVDFFKPNESFVEGTVMLKRAKEVGATLKYMTVQRLLRNKHRIPEELKKFDIVLPGTVRCFGKNKVKVISYICNKGGSWVEGIGGVKYDWGERARLLRVCN
ncbi:MAG: hypothetical protein Q7J30_00765 [Candidatus Azambacteria bacterium]|nr:hypothetical protein [Candidatus Azambacteria bacterium]